MDQQWQLIGRGLAGWHALGVSGEGHAVSGSGGDIVPRAWWADGSRIAPYQELAAEGCAVYDASAADHGLFTAWTLSGPMACALLPANGWDRYGHDGELPRALDRVGIERWINLLRARVPGVRFGRVEAGAIVWEGVE